jgi:hypothetical protein
MNITTPIQPNTNLVPDRYDQFLKVNQRVAGEVLNISNDQVVVAINGVQIVAKMTTPEQLAMLMERRYAYFIVKEINEKVVTLQLTNLEQGKGTSKQFSPASLGQSILEQMDLPADNGNLAIVQSMINRGIKVTPEMIQEFNQVLATKGEWGSKDAQFAASIKAAGLPLTAGSLSLAESAVKDLKQNLLNLYSALTGALANPGISSNTAQNIRAMLTTLKEVVVQSGDSQANLLLNIKNAMLFLGTSLEKEIGRIIKPEMGVAGNTNETNMLLTLANLRGQINNSTVRTAIDQFLDGVKWTHFQNVEPEFTVPKGQWAQLDLPIAFNHQMLRNLNEEPIGNLKIRVAKEADEAEVGTINPNYTRLVIQVDLNPNEFIKVDLSIVSNQIGAEIFGSNNEICLSASDELSEFQRGLSNLGYTLKTSKVEIGLPNLEMDIQEPKSTLQSMSSIDLGV